MATAEVIAPLKLEAVEPLEFGTVAVAAGGSGSITIDPANSSALYAGSLASSCSASAFCTAQPARFRVTGEPGRYYRIEHPHMAYASPVASQGPALEVRDIAVATDSLASSQARGLLPANGQDGFRVGGTLEVPGGTPAGSYRATLNVVVSYD